MRILSALALLGVLGLTSAAHADATAGPGMCAESDAGCGCTKTYCSPPLGPDMAVPAIRDMTLPRDLASPPDACLQRARQRQRGHGRGLILLSGMSVAAVFALRRRYKTSRPTPAESALAASDTRSDS